MVIELVELAVNPTAAKRSLDRANRYSMNFRVTDAKRPETRARRIKQFVHMLALGETIHPLKAKPRNSRNSRG